MTPTERADYLVKECGSKDKAISHVNWVLNSVKKQLTKEYWVEVLEVLKKYFL